MKRRRSLASKRDVPVVRPDRFILDETGGSPTVEVRVWQRGELIHRELCESAEAAADVVDVWSENEDVECEVDDLSVRHRTEEILEPSAEDYADTNSDREHGPRPSAEQTE